MQNLIILALLCTTPLFSNAQESVNAAGGDQNSTSGSISFTIGQIDYVSVSNNDHTLTLGVQQPYEIFVLSISPFVLDFTISAFPNPTNQFLNVHILGFSEQRLTYKIHDLSGKTHLFGSLDSDYTIVDLQSLSDASYIISIYDANNQFLQSFNIIKNI